MTHFPNFTTLPKIWLLMKLLFPSKEGWFSNSTYQRNASILASKFSNFVTQLNARVTWKYTWGGTDHMAQHLTATELMRKIEGHGHKLYMDSFFYSPEFFYDFAKKQIYCFGTVRLNRRGIPRDLALKTTKLKRGDICVRTRADLTAILLQDRRDICMLMNFHGVPAEGNFCFERGKVIKPQSVMDYNHHMGYVDKGDLIANSYSISRCTFKWTKKLFYLLDLVILSSYILRSSCGCKKISLRDFRFPLLRNMLPHAGPEQRIPRPLGRPPNVESHIVGSKSVAANIGLSRLRRSWGVACVRPGVWHKKLW